MPRLERRDLLRSGLAVEGQDVGRADEGVGFEMSAFILIEKGGCQRRGPVYNVLSLWESRGNDESRNQPTTQNKTNTPP